MRKLGVRGLMLLASAMPVVAIAQTAPQPPAQTAPPADEEDMGEEVVVTGELRGAVPGPIKPEVSLSPADIRTYGASNISDLLNALSPQLGAGTQPVILLSGRRSSLREIQNLPTEAIERIDILPEEAAAQYGYSATQKVINFVLRRRFQALTGVLEGVMPTAGGNSGEGGNIGILKLNRDSRINFDVKYGQNSGLLESERGVTRNTTSLFDRQGNITGFNGAEIDPALSAAAGFLTTVAGVPSSAAGAPPTLAAFAANANRANTNNDSAYRTLSGGRGARRFGGDDIAPLNGTPQQNLSVTGSYSPYISEKVSGTATLGFTERQSQTLLGLPSATLRLPVGNPYSPFSREVQLLRYYDSLNPLLRMTDQRTFNGDLSVNGDSAPWIASWRWSLQASYERRNQDNVTTTGIDPAPMQALLNAGSTSFNPFGPIPATLVLDRSPQVSRSTSSDAKIDLSTNGSLFQLPTGTVTATLRVAGEMLDKHSTSLTSGVLRTGGTPRDSASVSGNINVPLTSRRLGVLDAIGDLSISANFEVQQLSDFGNRVRTGYGLTWAPIQQIRANFSINNDQDVPSAEQLGDPLLVTPNRRIYDFVRNETVDITAITGGNPLLRAGNSRSINASVQLSPLNNLGINLRYRDTRTRNSTENFPGSSAEIETAFPSRFVRDPSGRLLSVDYRPVNFERSDRSALTTTVYFSTPLPSPQAERLRARRDAFQKARAESQRTGQPMPAEMTAMLQQFQRLGQQGSLFGSPNQRGQGQAPGQGQRQGDGQSQNQGGGQGGGGQGGGGRGFGGPGGGGGGGGGNQLRVSLTHTWNLKDESLIRTGLPVINALDGSSSRTTSTHQVQVMEAVKRDSWLFQLNQNWASGYRQMTGTTGSRTQLKFGGLATLGLLTEFNPGQNIDILVKHPWLRGARIQLRVDNLLDTKQRVTDQTGVTPASFLPNLVDPIGRTIRLTFRKQFF